MLSKLVLRVQRVFGGKCGELSIDQAAHLVGKAAVFFFDVNAPARFAQGHVPGASNIAPGKLDAGVLPPDRNATLVFYCGGSM